jgi:AcrR family transcriptional regulator
MENQEKILKKAVEMFFNLGIKETTMDNLAKALGISKKTLYKYYDNKDDLIKSAVEFFSKTIKGKIDEVRSMHLNPYEEFFAILEMINEVTKQPKRLPYKQLSKYYPELIYRMENKKKENIYAFLEENFEKGIRKGFYKKNLNRDFYKRIFVGCKKVLFDEDIFPVDAVSNYMYHALFLKLFLQSISTKKGKKVLKEVLKKYEL